MKPYRVVLTTRGHVDRLSRKSRDRSISWMINILCWIWSRVISETHNGLQCSLGCSIGTERVLGSLP